MELEKDSSLLQKLREEWTCPISHLPIRRPVITTTGNSYEKQDLTRWFYSNHTDPKSEEQLTYRQLIPNITLQNVIEIVEKELPKLEYQMTEQQNTISNLNEQITELKSELEKERERSQACEDMLYETVEGTKKIKRIQKNLIQGKQTQNRKLRQKIEQNQRYRKLISELRVELFEQQNKIKDGQFKIEELEMELGYLKQQISNHEYYDDLKWAWQDALDKDLVETVKRYNQQREVEFEYRKRIFKAIEKIYQALVDKNQMRENIIEGNIVEAIDKSVMANLELERKHQLNQPDLTAGQVDQITRRFNDLINYARKDHIARHKHGQTLTKLFTVYSNRHSDVFSRQSLKVIPFSVPVTPDELEINWGDVIQIHTGADYPVDQDLWDELIANIHRLPRLNSLKIDNCRMTNIPAEHLQKLRTFRILGFKQTNFSGDTEQRLNQFKNNVYWKEFVLEKL